MDTHIAEAIGRPDLIRLDDGLVCLRFESMKVISAAAAVRHLLDTGAVRRGDTLLDSSSGIYAYALALACHRYGLRCHIVGSTTVDRTLRLQLAVLGAKLEQMEPCDDLGLDQRRRVRRIEEILAENPGHHWMRQYHDDVHYLGYRAVASQVRRALADDGECGGSGDSGGSGSFSGHLTVVGAVGSGASTGALARYLREAGNPVQLVGVQPFGSVTFGSEHVRDPEMIIAGVGSSIPFGNVAHSSYDVLHWVAYEAALAGGVDLLRRHAVFAGLSTGAAYLAARYERDHYGGEDRTVLFLAPDTGHRYAESVFARHEEAAPLGTLAPHPVEDTAELALPWSRTAWNRAPAPAGARFRPAARD